MLVEPILLAVDPIQSQEDAESVDNNVPMFGLYAGNIVVLDDYLVHQTIQVWLCLNNLAVLVGSHRMHAELFMQETDLSSLYVRMRELPLFVGEEFWEHIDLPLLPPSGIDVLNILPEPQWNICSRRPL